MICRTESAYFGMKNVLVWRITESVIRVLVSHHLSEYFRFLTEDFFHLVNYLHYLASLFKY